MIMTAENVTVEQKVWRTHVGDPKTEARSGAVPVIPRLRKVLDAYRAEFPPKNEQTTFIFRGERRGFALDLHNVSQRVIKPAHRGRVGQAGTDFVVA